MAELGTIEGKTFLVTGGASGLGASYVESFLKRGAKNVAILDILEEVGRATEERLEKDYPGKVVFLKCDISNESDISEAFDAVVKKFGRVDTIVNNAGLMNDSPNVWAKMCDVNWKGLVSFTTKGIEHMRKDKGGMGGTIVNVSSVLGLMKLPSLPVYCGTKIAVLHFSQSIATPEFFERCGVRILTICFGPTDTPLLHNLDKITYITTEGKEMIEENKRQNVTYQKVESAVNGFLKMYEKGANGTVWVTSNDQPANDITEYIDKAYEILGQAVLGSGGFTKPPAGH